MGFLFRMGLWLAQWPSQKLAYRISRLFGRISDSLDTQAAQVTRINLQACFPNLQEDELKSLTLDSLTHMSWLFFEFAQLTHWHEKKLLDQVANVQGEAALDEAYASGEGVLLLVPHFGNWELLCAYLGLRYNFSALYDPPKIGSLEGVILRARKRFEAQMFAIDTGGMRNLLKVIRQGKLVAILPDQVPDRNAGVYAPFFGNTALTMTLIQRLLQKNPPRVMMASVQRISGRLDDAANKRDNEIAAGKTQPRYHISFEPLAEDIYSSDPVVSATTMNQAVETVIRRAPEQYQWEYKRFKRPPQKGIKNIYRRQ